MKIFDAFTTLRQNGHVLDQYSFDQRWLGKKPGYFGYLKSTQSEPSIETLMRLHFKLLEEEQKHLRYGLGTGELAKLAASTMDEVKQRCR